MEHPVNFHEQKDAAFILNQLTATLKEYNHWEQLTPQMVEKDLWICNALQKLTTSADCDQVVFKGGTSLTKGYNLLARFSEDIDLAIITGEQTPNAVKTIIRRVEKAITTDLTEDIREGQTQKKSRYRKGYFLYPTVYSSKISVLPQLVIETNAFANPYPYEKKEISSLLMQGLAILGREDLITLYGLKSFSVNVLLKQRTMLEKIVSLLRFSFASISGLQSKIRHFHDLYYLLNDEECNLYLHSPAFLQEMSELVQHDKLSFDQPQDWQQKSISESPLLVSFDEVWKVLQPKYLAEMQALSFKSIPQPIEIYEAMIEVLSIISDASFLSNK